jgi:subfamily B ATP-binding cassette protein MsbA
MQVRNALAPYLELAGYLRPYRVMVLFGGVCGVGFGAVSGTIPFLINFVGKTVFSSGDGSHTPATFSKSDAFSGIFFFFTHDILHLDHISKQYLVIFSCLLIPIVMMLRSTFDFLNSYCSEWTSQKVLMDIRAKLLKHITAQSLDYFDETRAGNLFQRVINETREMQSVLTIMSTQLISQPAALVSGLIVLFRLDWRFTVGALVLLPCCIGPMFYLTKKIRKESRSEEAERGEMMVILHEIIAGIKVIKSFSRTDHEVERFNASSRLQFSQIMHVRRVMETATPLVESLAAVGVAVGLYYVYSVGMSGSTFLSLCIGIFLLYQPLRTLSKLHLTLVRSHVVLASMFDLMRSKPSVEDAPDALPLRCCRGDIEFQNITFSYREGIPALENINLQFEAGKYYALVGASGAGKSTLFSLIMRFYDPDKGSVRVDGHDIRQLSQDSLRDNIGIVTQDTFLFHDTIFNNIAYGRLGGTREEVVTAAKQAYAHEFILAQQHGYETVVGDKGCKLSGGQQQRISIARALLKNAPILLLDEATSALDSASESQIQLALEQLTVGRTVVAIAHRLSTILKADKIIVLDRGKILQIGRHEDLLKTSKKYKDLYNIQFNV